MTSPAAFVLQNRLRVEVGLLMNIKVPYDSEGVYTLHFTTLHFDSTS